MRGSARAAYTLIELVIVITILGLLSAMAIPRFGRAHARHALDSAARCLADDIERTRFSAIASGASRAISFNLATDVYSAAIPDPDHPASTLQVNLADRFEVDLALVDLAGATTITFDFYGTPSAAGTLHLQSGREGRTVTVAAITGDASVSDWVNPAWSAQPIEAVGGANEAPQ